MALQRVDKRKCLSLQQRDCPGLHPIPSSVISPNRKSIWKQNIANIHFSLKTKINSYRIIVPFHKQKRMNLHIPDFLLYILQKRRERILCFTVWDLYPTVWNMYPTLWFLYFTVWNREFVLEFFTFCKYMKNATEETKDSQKSLRKAFACQTFFFYLPGIIIHIQHSTLLYLLLQIMIFTAENILMISLSLFFPAFSSVKPDTGLVFLPLYFSW